MVSFTGLLSAGLGLIAIANPVAALCKPAVGIEVFIDDWAFTMSCGRNDCNAPATTITIFHDDGTTTRNTFPSSVSFGFRESPQAQVHEWDFYGKYRDDPGLGFHVYGTRCPTLPNNQGVGCFAKALKIERGYLPKATWVKYKCGRTW